MTHLQHSYGHVRPPQQVFSPGPPPRLFASCRAPAISIDVVRDDKSHAAGNREGVARPLVTTQQRVAEGSNKRGQIPPLLSQMPSRHWPHALRASRSIAGVWMRRQTGLEATMQKRRPCVAPGNFVFHLMVPWSISTISALSTPTV